MTFLWFLLAAMLFCLGAYFCAFSITGRQPQKDYDTPGKYHLEYQETSFITEDGIPLRGWWLPSPGSTRTIVFLHGYAGSCNPDLKYAPDFHLHGFNLLLFDFRAHGRSGGKITSVGALETRDCKAAVEFAVQRGSRSIGLLGFSMGGRVAILSAPDLEKVKAVISDGGPARFTTALAGKMKLKRMPGFLSVILAYFLEFGMCLRCRKNLFSCEPLHQAHRLKAIPFLFIHGGQDPYTTLKEVNQMAASAGEKAEVWYIPRAGHRNADQILEDKYNKRIIAFFEKHLPK